MCNCRSSARRHTKVGGLAGRGDWAAWLPLVFIGAMMFWTVALGLGGWSLMAVTDGSLENDAVVPTATAVEPKPGSEVQEAAANERIPVQMEESQEPEDVDDNAGAAPPSTPVWPVVAPSADLVR